jgi:hypothetical protein
VWKAPDQSLIRGRTELTLDGNPNFTVYSYTRVATRLSDSIEGISPQGCLDCSFAVAHATETTLESCLVCESFLSYS